MKGHPSARTAATACAERDAGNPELRGVLGWIFLAQDEPGKARPHLEATWGTPVAERYAVFLAKVRLAAGDFEGAAEADIRPILTRAERTAVSLDECGKQFLVGRRRGFEHLGARLDPSGEFWVVHEHAGQFAERLVARPSCRLTL